MNASNNDYWVPDLDLGFGWWGVPKNGDFFSRAFAWKTHPRWAVPLWSFVLHVGRRAAAGTRKLLLYTRGHGQRLSHWRSKRIQLENWTSRGLGYIHVPSFGLDARDDYDTVNWAVQLGYDVMMLDMPLCGHNFNIDEATKMLEFAISVGSLDAKLDRLRSQRYPVVIINCVHYLGPPGPSPSQILGTFSRFSETFLAKRERGGP